MGGDKERRGRCRREGEEQESGGGVGERERSIREGKCRREGEE